MPADQDRSATQDMGPLRPMSSCGTELETWTVPADARSTARFLRTLADSIEAHEGDRTLIGLWNTGFGGPEEFCFQVVEHFDNGSRGGDERV